MLAGQEARCKSISTARPAYQRCECTSVNLLVWWCSWKCRCTAQLAFCGESSKVQNIARPLLWGEYSSGLEKHTKMAARTNWLCKDKSPGSMRLSLPQEHWQCWQLIKAHSTDCGRLSARPLQSSCQTSSQGRRSCSGLGSRLLCRAGWARGSCCPPYGHRGQGRGPSSQLVLGQVLQAS